MNSEQDLGDELIIKQYLLGTLGEEEQAKVQDRLLCDRDFFDILLVEENELTDDYLRGALTEKELYAFKNYFLASPEHRRKLRFARAFKKRISSAAIAEPIVEPKSWLKPFIGFLSLRYTVVAMALLVLAAGSWLAVDNWRLRNQLKQRQAEQAEWVERARELEHELEGERGQSQNLAEQLEGEQNQRAVLEREVASLKQAHGSRESGGIGTVVSFILMPGLGREGDKPNLVQIPPGAGQVRLQLELEKVGHRNYRAELRTAEGRRVWSQSGLKLQQTASVKQVVVSLPTKILRRDDYILTLRGATAEGDYERAGTYFFRVVKQ